MQKNILHYQLHCSRSLNATYLKPCLKADFRSIRRGQSSKCTQQLNDAQGGEAEKQDPFAEKIQYEDGPISQFFIDYFAKVMAKELGQEVQSSYTYEEFVTLSRQIMKGRTSLQQQETVAGVMKNLLPEEAADRFRKLFPPTKFSAETNAVITKQFFKWLVGDMDVVPVELNPPLGGPPEVWNSQVHIHKCRYLENSGCVGMCTNMCKLPTQAFFTNTFGLPLTMNPNFEDLSCEMVFGVSAPPVSQDEVYNKPCLAVCGLDKSDPSKPCPKIDTSRQT